MDNKILIVYNTCGLSNKDNSIHYIESLKTILDQKEKGFDIVFSGCLIHPIVRDKITSQFGSLLSYNFTDEIHPVNVTFNHSVMKCVQNKGEYNGYMYVDSGTSFVPNLLKEIYKRLLTNKYGMITPQPSNDTEYYAGLHVGRHREDDEYARNILFKHGDYIIPIGKGMGTHTNVVSNDLRKFYGNVYPDIFASHCTESTFSFLNAALNKQWLLMKDFILPHKISMDGQSSGFSPARWQFVLHRPSFDHPYKIKSIIDRIVTKEAASCGFGYEECRGILNHDKTQFDTDYHCTNNNLKHFIKNNLFLKKQELNYDNIRSKFTS